MTIKLTEDQGINFIQTGVSTEANSVADLRITNNNSTSGTTFMTITTSGNIGIGTTSPISTLHVNGNGIISNLSIGNLNATALSTLQNVTSTNITTGVLVATTGITTSTINASGAVSINATGSQQLVVAGSSTRQLLVGYNATSNHGVIEAIEQGVGYKNLSLCLNGGNVGIGRSSPSSKLDINGGLNVTGTSTLQNVTSTNVTTGGLIATGITAGSSLFSNLFITSGSLNATFNSNTIGSIITTGGNVGIGTSSPGSNLSISASSSELEVRNTNYVLFGTSTLKFTHFGDGINRSSFIRSILPGSNQQDLQFITYDGSANITPMVVKGSGNIGIGTTAPTTKLDVFSSGVINSRASSVVEFRGSPSSDTPETILRIGRGHSGGVMYGASAEFQLYRGYTSASRASSALAIRLGQQYDDNPDTTVMTMWANGNIGIGTTNPGYQLTLTGSIGMDNNQLLYAKNPGGTYEGVFWPRAGNGTYLNYGTQGFYIRNSASTLRMFISDGGNINVPSGAIGVGTSDDPTLIYNGDTPISNSNVRLALLNNTSGTEYGYSSLLIGGNNRHYSLIQGGHETGGLTYLLFGTCSTAGPPTERMRITASGNVGIGTVSPGSTLSVNGSLSKSSGTFDIEHPTQENKRLVHSFIEGPRVDLIYRGSVTLSNGTATVNLDKDCVAEQDCAMTEGTFEALCANPQYFLQNHSSFNRVKGSISGNILTIVCEDSTSLDVIHWTVIAERKDQFIKQWERTNSKGYLKTEY